MSQIPETPVCITAAYIDRENVLGVRQSCMLLQDAMTGLFAANGCDGITMLRESGSLWFIARTACAYRRAPRWLERISMCCWPARITAGAVTLNFRAAAGDGETLLTGRMDMGLLDAETRRPRRLRGTAFPPDMETRPAAYTGGYTLWPAALPEGEPVWEAAVSCDDTDMNDHANNLWYIRAAVAAAGRTALPRGFEITYLRECRLGQRVLCHRHVLPEGVGIELRERGEPVARAIFRLDFPENPVYTP